MKKGGEKKNHPRPAYPWEKPDWGQSSRDIEDNETLHEWIKKEPKIPPIAMLPVLLVIYEDYMVLKEFYYRNEIGGDKI